MGPTMVVEVKIGRKASVGLFGQLIVVKIDLLIFDAVPEAIYEQTLARERTVGNKDSIAWVLERLGEVAFYQGDAAQAARCFAESLALYREIVNKRGIGNTLSGTAGVIALTGSPDAT